MALYMKWSKYLMLCEVLSNTIFEYCLPFDNAIYSKELFLVFFIVFFQRGFEMLYVQHEYAVLNVHKLLLSKIYLPDCLQFHG